MAAQVDKITYTSTPEQIQAMHAAFDAANRSLPLINIG